jgi:hypothetical protein
VESSLIRNVLLHFAMQVQRLNEHVSFCRAGSTDESLEDSSSHSIQTLMKFSGFCLLICTFIPVV